MPLDPPSYGGKNTQWFLTALLCSQSLLSTLQQTYKKDPHASQAKKAPETAHLAASIPDGSNMQVVPEGRPFMLVVQQLHCHRPVGGQGLAQPLHLRLVGSRALQESAVPAYHRLPAQDVNALVHARKKEVASIDHIEQLLAKVRPFNMAPP